MSRRRRSLTPEARQWLEQSSIAELRLCRSMERAVKRFVSAKDFADYLVAFDSKADVCNVGEYLDVEVWEAMKARYYAAWRECAVWADGRSAWRALLLGEMSTEGIPAT
jgi:hypothetical protein